jgi:hypothetical protein
MKHDATIWNQEILRYTTIKSMRILQIRIGINLNAQITCALNFSGPASIQSSYFWCVSSKVIHVFFF